MARATVLRVERRRVVSAADMIGAEETLRVEDTVIEWQRELTLYPETGILVSQVIAALAAWAILEGLDVEISALDTQGKDDEQSVWLVDWRAVGGKPRAPEPRGPES